MGVTGCPSLTTAGTLYTSCTKLASGMHAMRSLRAGSWRFRPTTPLARPSIRQFAPLTRVNAALRVSRHFRDQHPHRLRRLYATHSDPSPVSRVSQPAPDMGKFDSSERLAGLRHAMREAGVDVYSELDVPSHSPQPHGQPAKAAEP